MIPFFNDADVFVNNFYESAEELGFMEAVAIIQQLMDTLDGVPVFEAHPNGDFIEHKLYKNSEDYYYNILTVMPPMGDEMIKEATFLVRKMVYDRIIKSRESGDNET
jgi:hypothetical protein